MKCKILFPIDQKWRDLPGNILIGSYLKKNNFNVIYCRAGKEKYFVELFQPDIVILNHVRSDENNQLSIYLKKKRNVRVFVLPTEGIPTLKEGVSHELASNKDLSGVCKIFSWGNFTKELFIKNQNKNIVIGAHRFDFYDRFYSDLVFSKNELFAKYDLNSVYQTVLIATNFTKAGFFKKNRKFFQNDLIKQNVIGYINKFYKGLSNITKEDYLSREILIKSLKEIIIEYPNRNYILKLHPSEDQVFYDDIFRGLNVRIISSEYIWNLLPHVDTIVNRSCTTSLEAWILSKPTIEFRLNPNELHKSDLHSSGSLIVKSHKELEQALIQSLRSPKKFIKPFLKKREKTLLDLIGFQDGKRSREIANEITKLSKNNKADWTKKNNIYRFIARVYLFKNYFFHDIRLYGFFNYLCGKKVDNLGRLDKHINNNDINFWEAKIMKFFKKKLS